MSATNFSNVFGIELSPELAADLEEQFKAVDTALAADDSELARSSKLGLVSLGSTLYATFFLGPRGRGKCTAKGTGAFNGHEPPPGLVGDYTLDIDSYTVKLYEPDGRLIWKGLGAQKGLSGKWTVEF